jgi:hypothetical protein
MINAEQIRQFRYMHAMEYNGERPGSGEEEENGKEGGQRKK